MVARSLEELQNFVVTDRSHATSSALITIARQMKSIPGRKSLVWVSGSFPLFVTRPRTTLNFSDEINRAGHALTDANVAVYPVDARGLGVSFLTAEQSGQPAGSCLKTGEPCLPAPGRGSSPSGIDTMNTLADLTGGRAYYNTNGIEDSIRQATDDAEVTYTLGFYPGDEPDEKFHRLTVKVTGKGRDVRFRRGYYAATP
jgi:VWFA-related protein